MEVPCRRCGADTRWHDAPTQHWRVTPGGCVGVSWRQILTLSDLQQTHTLRTRKATQTSICMYSLFRHDMLSRWCTTAGVPATCLFNSFKTVEFSIHKDRCCTAVSPSVSVSHTHTVQCTSLLYILTQTFITYKITRYYASLTQTLQYVSSHSRYCLYTSTLCWELSCLVQLSHVTCPS